MVVEKKNTVVFSLDSEEATYLKNILYKYAEDGDADIHNFAGYMADSIGVLSDKKEDVNWRVNHTK
jgi:hypothetical protein